MTYKELADKILALPKENQNQDVAVYSSEWDEFYPAEDFFVADNTDVLDSGHPYITLK